MKEVETTNNPLNNEEAVEPLFPLVVFKLDSVEYAIRIEQIKEVTVTPKITTVPQSFPSVIGIANIRGDIVAILDVQKKFNLSNVPKGKPADGKTYTIVVEKGNYLMGVLVKKVPQTMTVALSQIDRTPDIIKNSNCNERYIEGIVKVEDRLVILLNIQKVLNLEEEKVFASLDKTKQGTVL